MKRKFLATRNAVFRDRRLISGVLFVLAASFFVLVRFVAPDTLISATAPLARTSAAVTGATGSFFSSFTERARLVSERDNLQHEVDALSARERALMEELSDMRRLLGTRTTAHTEIPAAVLMRPPVSPYDTFVVNAGTTDRVAVGAYVSGPDGVPVGTVSEVEARSARVVLFSASGRETEGWAGEERIPITLIGEGAGAFSATIPQGTTLVVGDVVIVPGFLSAPIGTIRAIKSDPSSPTSEVMITPFVNPFSMAWVTITIPSL